MEVRVGKRDGLGRPDFGLGKPEGRGRPRNRIIDKKFFTFMVLPEILGFEVGRSLEIDLSLGFVMIAVFSFRSIVLSKTGRFPFVIVPVRESVRFGFSIVPESGTYGPFVGPSPASVGIIEKSKSTDSFRFSACGVDCFPPNVDSNCFGIKGRTGDALAALTRVGETECVLSLDILRCELARTGRVAICFGGEAGRVGEPPESYRFLLNGEGDRLNVNFNTIDKLDLYLSVINYNL